MSQRVTFATWILFAAGLPLVAPAQEASKALHAAIDRIVEGSFVGRPATAAADAEFLRRVWIDLTGMIPSSEEARAFLDDPDPEKRTKLIDRLLASPEHVRHMATVLDVMLMERRPQKVVTIDEWQKYIHESVAANKPFDQLAREILAADGTDEKNRAAARFYLDRDGEVNLLTRDTGRIFFGRDLQCAQCHDHPLISDYHQTEYYGLSAFFIRTSLFTDPKDKKIYLAEKADGEASYQSVFDESSKGTTLPTLPGGEAITDPAFPAGEEYTVKPEKDVRPIPKYSRRQKFSDVVANNRHFNRNIANRLWAMMFGRGLVQPVDLHHGDNPSGHPELTELLGESFAAMKYDMRAFLREIALSRTYQRSFEMPSDVEQQAIELAAKAPEIQSAQEQAKVAVEAATNAAIAARQQLSEAEKAAAAVETELAQARTQEGEAKKAHDVAVAALAVSQEHLTAKQDVQKTVREASAKVAEAAAKLTGDAEVADAASKMKAKADALTAEVVALTQTVAAQQAAMQETAARLAAAQQTVAAVEQTTAAPRQAVEAARQAVTTAETNSAAAKTALASVEQRRIDVQKLTEFAQVRSDAEAARVALEAAKKAVADHQPVVAQANQLLTQRQGEMAAVEKTHAEAAAAVSAAQVQQTAKAETAKSVADLAAQAEAVRQKAPEDAALAQAAQTLAERSQQLQSELAEVQKLVAEKEQAAKTAADALAAARQAFEQSQTNLSTAQTKQNELDAAAANAHAAADSTAGALETAHQELADAWTRRAAVGAVRPLSPEQLAWTMMRAAGLVDQQRRAAEAEANKTITPEVAAADPAKAVERAKIIEQTAFNALKGNVGQFVNLFAASAGQPQDQFFATADQALFFDNGSFPGGWLNPGGGNLTERLVNMPDPNQLAEELYLSVLTRRPAPEEASEVEVYMTPRTEDRPAAIKELTWALLTSSEFRFNH